MSTEDVSNINIDLGDIDATYVNITQALNRVAGNAKLYAKLLKSFEENTRMNDLLEALDKNDVESAAKAAHTIKGVTANLSLLKICELITAIEQGLKNGQMPGDELDKAKECMDATLEQIEKAIAYLGEVS